jgi:hypothetical protein
MCLLTWSPPVLDWRRTLCVEVVARGGFGDVLGRVKLRWWSRRKDHNRGDAVLLAADMGRQNGIHGEANSGKPELGFGTEWNRLEFWGRAK